MKRQSSPAEALDELIHWVSQQLSQRELLPNDHRTLNDQRGVWRNLTNGEPIDFTRLYATPAERTSDPNYFQETNQ